jgi:hypothetical protein
MEGSSAGIRALKCLKRLHLEHIPRQLLIPNPEEERKWFDHNCKFLSQTFGYEIYPMSAKCHREIGTLNLDEFTWKNYEVRYCSSDLFVLSMAYNSNWLSFCISFRLGPYADSIGATVIKYSMQTKSEMILKLMSSKIYFLRLVEVTLQEHKWPSSPPCFSPTTSRTKWSRVNDGLFVAD